MAPESAGSAAKAMGLSVRPVHFSFVVLALLVIWIALLLRLKREYVHSLLSALQGRTLDFSGAPLRINDEATLSVLKEALVSTKRGYVLHALELLKDVERLDDSFCQLLLKLLDHPDTSVRKAVLNCVEGKAVVVEPKQIARNLFDRDNDVRSAAIRAYCAVKREQALAVVEPFLRDESVQVQGAAVAALMRYGGLDGILMGADCLKALLAAGDAVVRERGAWVLGEIGVRTFYQPLLPLLHDDSQQVRTTAIDAAGKITAPELVGELISQLACHYVAAHAVKSLVAYGTDIQGLLFVVLDNPAEPIAVRRMVLRVLSHFDNADSSMRLQQFLNHQDILLREEAIQSLKLQLQSYPGLTVDQERIRASIQAEAAHIIYLVLAQKVFHIPHGTSCLLLEALQEQRTKALLRVFRLLELVYPGNDFDIVHANLHSREASVRANAIELLDNLLSKPDKNLILPLLDDGGAAQLLKKPPASVAVKSREEYVHEFFQADDPWMRVCALHLVATGKDVLFLEEVRGRLHDSDPLVRQTALWALSKIADRVAVLDAARFCRDDREELVAHYDDFVMREVCHDPDD